MARGGVVLRGRRLRLLALGARGVAELVEESSSFGSARGLVVVLFARFTEVGGPLAAAAPLLGGLGSYVAGPALGWSYPFLTSMAAAVRCDPAGATGERRRRAPPGDPPG
jgi:hypothetical protein